MNTKKIFLILGGLCLAAAIGLFAFKTRYESGARAEIENILASLPSPLTATAEKIDVSFFNKSVTLTNLRGTYAFTQTEDGREVSVPIEFSVARTHAEGVNADAFQPGAGVAKFLDSLELTDTKFTSPLVQAATETYLVKGVSGDFSLLKKEISEALPALIAAYVRPDFPANPEETKALMLGGAAFLRAYETLAVETAFITNYSYSITMPGQKIDILLGAMEGKDYSLRRMGPLAVKNITADINGAPLLRMESSSFEEMILPSFVDLFTLLAETPEPSPELVQSIFKGQPFAVKNFRIKNLDVRHPMENGRNVFSLEESDFSYVAETAHTMDFFLKGLGMAKDLLRDGTGLPEEALASLPDMITFEATVQKVLTPKAPYTYDIDVKKVFVKGSGLGEANFSLAADDVNSIALLMGMPSKAALKSFAASITDSGVSSVLFAAGSANSDQSADQFRAETVADMRENLENETSPIGRKILSALIQFVETPGGTFAIAITPPEPLTLDKLATAYTAEPETLGLSVTVTPGQL